MSRLRSVPHAIVIGLIGLGIPGLHPSAARGLDDAEAVTAAHVSRPTSDVAPPVAPPPYPLARRADLVETQFGVPVADPYRWLENDARTDGEVAQWVAAENDATAHYLAALPGREALRTRIAQLYDYERYGTPRKAGGRYFYTRNSGLQNQSPLYVREGAAHGQRLLLDPNSFSEDGASALGEWQPSTDGRWLLYAVQDGGTDWRTLHVLDVEKGQPLDDRVAWVRYSNLTWSPDGRGFYYSRFPAPQDGERSRSPVEDQAVWFHALGTPQSADRLVYATPDRPRLMHRAQITDDGRWLLVISNESTERRHEVTLISLTGEARAPVRLVRGLSHEWQFIGNVGDMLYFRTTMGAPNGRVVTLDATRPRKGPQSLVAERSQTLAGASMVGSRMILAYQSDGRIMAELADLQGLSHGDVPLPGPGAASGFSGRSGDPETFFSFSSFTTPSTVYRYNVETGETSVFAEPRLPFDPDAYVTEQVLYPSKDGTMIPMQIIRRRDLALAARSAPTLLYGYGGFNISQTPGFSPTRFAWIEQGGVLAIASLRGGGEFGKAWHDAGRLSNKQNVFDDFIAAAEYLKQQGYTGPDQLAIEGRSNGGLLVGAVVNQRPDLFAAALPAVGVMDMLRFDRFTVGRYWIDDYGSPDREPDFRNLLSYSPYHNIRDGIDYPAILVSTADTDDRVVPAHSFKYAAALQHAELGVKPRLIRIATRAGHGSGKPVDKLVEEYADMYSFIAYWTGLDLKAP
ncbi:prolyl endopeptidase [Sphingobium sp. SYK-6]|uniref:prolyl oligopeptidase family serine peptidase n=1 Tax=Sphingobium sp. (strain NBRC 103272 / SYK-6) TaxID=627192 RepID=UPI0002277B96|nr:prolyl oligopeptidase family serine peptidase [Sphingobium sp. SYK-6]BAK68211.1 prolyl endopeptidase [Sphingobium sp. SYK-6]